MENKVGWVFLICILVFVAVWLVNPRIVGRVIETFYTTTSTTTTTTPLEVFEINDAYTDDHDGLAQISQTDVNRFVIEVRGKIVPSITFPVKFNQPARDVTFSYMCLDRVSQVYLYSENYKFNPEGEIRAENWEHNVSTFAYWGAGDSEDFILTNRGDFGTKIEYTGKGTVRALIFFDWLPNERLNFDQCRIKVISMDPPHVEEKYFFIAYKP